MMLILQGIWWIISGLHFIMKLMSILLRKEFFGFDIMPKPETTSFMKYELLYRYGDIWFWDLILRTVRMEKIKQNYGSIKRSRLQTVRSLS